MVSYQIKNKYKKNIFVTPVNKKTKIQKPNAPRKKANIKYRFIKNSNKTIKKLIFDEDTIIKKLKFLNIEE